MAEQPPKFVYDLRARQYRGPDGRFVPVARVAAAVDAVSLGARAEASRLGERLVAGSSSLAEFQQSLMATIKASHVAAAIAGRGGKAMMSASDYLWVARRIKEQYAFARNFAAGIANGARPLNGTLAARAGLYGDALAATHREMERRVGILAGATEERNVLGPSDHCSGCLDATGQGWVPVGTLPPVGTRTCLARCKCSIRTRVAASESGGIAQQGQQAA